VGRFRLVVRWMWQQEHEEVLVKEVWVASSMTMDEISSVSSVSRSTDLPGSAHLEILYCHRTNIEQLP